MKTYKVAIKGVTPYTMGKYVDIKKGPQETHDDFEDRTWRERCNYDENGMVFIPPMAFKNALVSAAQYISVSIPGAGKKTYTKKFESGLFIQQGVELGVHKDDVSCQTLMVPSDGMRGGTKRVRKSFPILHKWSGELEVIVLDEIITKEVLLQHIEAAGQFIGIGTFRPRNNGYHGRFIVTDIVEVANAV